MNHKCDAEFNPVPCEDVTDWAKWLQESDRSVAKSYVGGTFISTVFLGVGHRFGGDGPPVLFETMVFDGPMDQETERYCTIKEALDGHERMVKRVEANGGAS